MAVVFTPSQTKVLEARKKDVLVSAAAGSGKTAVMVERIVRMISDPGDPVDIDRLLVVTFTRAAAAQMRERIGKAIEKRLDADPENINLRRQEVLLHNAQITTIDSFCTYLVRNHFSEIDLDPGFRQMDEYENKLLQQDVLDTFLEEKYSEAAPAFLSCVDYFCSGTGDQELTDIILKLHELAQSHASPRRWLMERMEDYQAPTPENLPGQEWMRGLYMDVLDGLLQARTLYRQAIRICLEPGGPYPYADQFEEELRVIFASFAGWDAAKLLRSLPKMDGDELSQLYEDLRLALSTETGRLSPISAKKYPDVLPQKKEAAAELRKKAKEVLGKKYSELFSQSAQTTCRMMAQMEETVRTLISLTLEYEERLQLQKKEKNVIDFSDLEHFALQILLEEQEDGTYTPRKTAKLYQTYFREVLVDEYQDSNDVQELLLHTIEGDGRHARFMVGDVKQSIYRFRLARPEIFMEKLDTYPMEDDEACQRIDLDQNFRSRREVLSAVNEVFMKIMDKNVGGVSYDETVSLKQGAVYPELADEDSSFAKSAGEIWGDDPYRTELLLMETETDPDEDTGAGTDAGKEDAEVSVQDMGKLQKECMMIAGRIKAMVGSFPVTDEESRHLRPARFGDIVILVRSGTGISQTLREIFEKEGIPLYVDSGKGYFAAQEIREVISFLRTLDNPRQDISLYGAMHGFFGGFTADEIARIHAQGKEMCLYDALKAAAGNEDNIKCRKFLNMLDRYRSRTPHESIRQLLLNLFRETGYETYAAALPGGAQRLSNLELLLMQAENFEKTAYTGLFQFLRYLDKVGQAGIDYGEANTLDEKADVVRLMTIHKSKGLEFPICFVAGLDKKYNIAQDTRGTLICDNDMGLGIRFFDPQTRVLCTTLRREAAAARIRRDALGEELRILYVAMTRAKEKLILTAKVKNAEKYLNKENRIEKGDTKVPVMDTSSYLDLIEKSLPYAPSIHVCRADMSEMEVLETAEQTGLFMKRQMLAEQELASPDMLPDDQLARALAQSFAFRYPHEDLKGLYTKTTVSELKRRMNTEADPKMDPPGEGAAAASFLNFEVSVQGETAGSGFDTLQSGEQAPQPPRESTIPQFMKETDQKDEGAQSLTGAARGTAVHRICQLFDYRRFPEPSKVTKKQYDLWLRELVDQGTVTEDYIGAAPFYQMRGFLSSPLCARMAEAAQQNALYREQPFVLGISARDMDTSFPKDETVLIQGIIDAFFMEEGGVVIVDYKTDRVKTPDELVLRYKIQMDYYTQAVSRILGHAVKERCIYSFALGETIRV